VHGVKSALIARLNESLDAVFRHKGEICCDSIAISGGWNPTVHLHGQSGGKPLFSEHCASIIPGLSVQKETSAGAANGTFSLIECLREGADVGRLSAEKTGFKKQPYLDIPSTDKCSETPLSPIWVVPNGLEEGRGAKKFIDYQNDTTVADVLLAVREGYKSVEHLKRYTALGFGTDQGKLGNINGLAIFSAALGKSPTEVGTTTFRPNYTPVTFGAIAGRRIGPNLFDPIRKTALHRNHLEQGAMF
jgi:sarcosine oxidase subunit alpha